MIPFLDKTIVKLTLAIALLGLIGTGLKFTYDAIFQAGVNSVVATISSTTIDTLNSNVENSNEDKIMLEKSTKEITEAVGKAKSDNKRIPSTNVYSGCAFEQYRELYEQARFTSHAEQSKDFLY